MPGRSFALVGAALIGLGALAPSAALAQYWGGPPPPPPPVAYYYDRGYGWDAPPPPPPPPPRVVYARPYYGGYHRYRCDRGTGGAIVGAIAGGLLGNVVAGRGDRGIGTLFGAGAGALAGRAVDRHC
ncbi:glycine zipper 2TM domain-containing protein [Sphingomonas nostoxanthinifaciens]|uniref:glycine zipper 2TM domain-containing protein n=1 Tax=Sphingomonas nostoxanthinifaciens TaxID=2872652 RepID=UPI001CC1D32B|nr:glycine zipper 2TM domain-containing protein [Sphingomonas nostoxanthinifaciens]UAK24465.1 glycine zipper 2TM domain-containing protein [Sphingomonas nostoxanthinifaciens]